MTTTERSITTTAGTDVALVQWRAACPERELITVIEYHLAGAAGGFDNIVFIAHLQVRAVSWRLYQFFTRRVVPAYLAYLRGRVDVYFGTPIEPYEAGHVLGGSLLEVCAGASAAAIQRRVELRMYTTRGMRQRGGVIYGDPRPHSRAYFDCHLHLYRQGNQEAFLLARDIATRDATPLVYGWPCRGSAPVTPLERSLPRHEQLADIMPLSLIVTIPDDRWLYICKGTAGGTRRRLVLRCPAESLIAHLAR